MRKVVVTFGGKAYEETTSLTVSRAPQMGADEVLVFDDKWLMESPYYAVNRWIFDASSQIQNKGPQIRHGFGWCSWKAFLILSAFERIQPGDVVLYLDGDTFPVAPFGDLFAMCAAEGGVLVFEEPGASALRFTKADCFLAMGMEVQDLIHACGRFSLWQKGSFLAQQMLCEWYAYSINPRCTLWDTSILRPDQPEYHRNSTEQSVLGNLARKYNLPLHRGPDQFGGPHSSDGQDAYPQVFEQRDCQRSLQGDRSGSRYRNV